MPMRSRARFVSLHQGVCRLTAARGPDFLPRRDGSAWFVTRINPHYRGKFPDDASRLSIFRA
jgi:hypothetical protein